MRLKDTEKDITCLALRLRLLPGVGSKPQSILPSEGTQGGKAAELRAMPSSVVRMCGLMGKAESRRFSLAVTSTTTEDRAASDAFSTGTQQASVPANISALARKRIHMDQSLNPGTWKIFPSSLPIRRESLSGRSRQSGTSFEAKPEGTNRC